MSLWGWAINSAYLWETSVFGWWWVTPPPSNWLLNDLISYYKMDTNGSFPDAHWSNDWTINGATYTASGKINWGYDFDWVNDYVSIPNNVNLDNDFTIATWFNTDVLDSNLHFIYTWFKTKNISLELRGAESLCNFQVTDALSVAHKVSIPYSSLSAGTWYHMVWTRSTTDGLELFINWVSIDTDTFTWAWSSLSLDNRIWAHGSLWSRYFNWPIDETGFWQTILTQTQITALYNSWSGLSYDSFTT